MAGAIFVAIDPARRLHETRNARRSSDVTTILDSLKKYQADNGGTHFDEIADLDANVNYGIGTGGDTCATCTAVGGVSECVDIEDMGENYLAVVPSDPKVGSDNETGYYLLKSNLGAITVGACEPEGEGPGGGGTPPGIEITR